MNKKIKRFRIIVSGNDIAETLRVIDTYILLGNSLIVSMKKNKEGQEQWTIRFNSTEEQGTLIYNELKFKNIIKQAA